LKNGIKLALCLNKQLDVLWWYRNKVGSESLVVRAYQKNGVYPEWHKDKPRTGVPRTRCAVNSLQRRPDWRICGGIEATGQMQSERLNPG